MEKTKLPPPTMTRTEYVISNLVGVRSPMEFSVAEKMALRRLSELEKIVKGISSKWFKNKTDIAMIDQTKAEMGRIGAALEEKRAKFGAV
jgi:poly(3-hydroxyalkanoate) synthetase